MAAAALAGCGGDDPAPEAGSKTTTTGAKAAEKAGAKGEDRAADHDAPAPSEPVSSEDRAKIVAVLEKMEGAINDGDADRLCADVYAFGADTTKSDCVKVFETVLKQSEARAEITLRSVQRKGSRATVNVVNRGVGGGSRQSFRFVERDDEWRVLFD